MMRGRVEEEEGNEFEITRYAEVIEFCRPDRIKTSQRLGTKALDVVLVADVVNGKRLMLLIELGYHKPGEIKRKVYDTLCLCQHLMFERKYVDAMAIVIVASGAKRRYSKWKTRLCSLVQELSMEDLELLARKGGCCAYWNWPEDVADVVIPTVFLCDERVSLEDVVKALFEGTRLESCEQVACNE